MVEFFMLAVVPNFRFIIYKFYNIATKKSGIAS